jgi:hypothetical protein
VDGEDWEGLTVCTRDGHPLGIVVGVFAEGPLAGRLRVHGAYVPGPRAMGWPAGTAVYAIPRHALESRSNGSLWLGVTPRRARTRWLMHIVTPTKA